jgi:hypothetical protein
LDTGFFRTVVLVQPRQVIGDCPIAGSIDEERALLRSIAIGHCVLARDLLLGSILTGTLIGLRF